MATKIVHTSNNVQRTTVSHEPAARKLQGSIPELRRLATFRSRNANMHPTLSKGLLAKNGFRYKDAENKAICEACDFEIELSISASDLIGKHMEQSPECQFVVNRNEVFPATNQLTSFSISNISQTNTSDSNYQNSLNQDQIIPEKSFLNSLSDEAINKLRASTFSNWPLITPNAQDMIVAGWSYTNIADRVICIYCDALYHKWTESDRPYEIHQLKSPKCPFVLLAEKKAPVAPTRSITITTEPTTQAAVGAVNTAYALSCRRYESFNNWPQNEDEKLPSIETFVDAGFYYEGDKTIVRCFYCNGALRNWQTGDDPKVEHARWYPHCAYIRQYIGEDLYQAIQRKNRELKALQKYSGSTNTQTSQIAPWTDDETDRMVKARLDLPVVEKLRQAGFSMAIIRKSFEMQLKFKKDDFKTDNDLRLACLILDRQVKLINGNEANLLVPEEWLKKFIEDQAQGMQQQSETSKPQILSIQVPKISAPILPEPKIIQQSDKEAMPCVLCLTAERQVACLPCGHLTSCVACGHSLKTCPICRATIKAFVRIYA